MSSREKLKSIRTGKWSRSFEMAKSYVGGGGRTLAHVISTSLLPKEEREAERLKLIVKEVQSLVLKMGELKGTFQKVGQALSMYGEHLFPGEVAEVLKRLQSDAPEVEWEPIYSTLKEELQEKLADLDIDENAIGTASIGQVHRARIRSTGEVLALKVQYPGVALAVENDIKILRQVFKTMSFIPKGPQFDSVFEEVKEMLFQELDYGQELAHLERVRGLLGKHPGYILPKSYPQYSTGKILAMSFESGVPMDSPEVKGATEEVRQKIGGLMLANYFQELLSWGVVQTDPHFGNYRVRFSDGNPQLVLFDFGALRTVSGVFIKGYRRMLKGTFFQDIDEIIAGAVQIGFLFDTDEPALKKEFANLCLLVAEPFHAGVGPYDFSKSDLPKRAALKGTELVFRMKLRPPPRELVFLDRKMTGVFVFLSALKVPIDGRPYLATHFGQS